MGQQYSINFIRDNNILWTMTGPRNAPYDLAFITGAVVAGNFIWKKMSDLGTFNGERFQIIHQEKQSTTILTPDEVIEQSGFRKYTETNWNSPETNWLSSLCSNAGMHYNMWIKDGNNVGLFSFTSDRFIQGLLTIANAFRINYRELIVAAPLFVYYHNGVIKSTYVAIEGYPLSFLPLYNQDGLQDNVPDESHLLCDVILNGGIESPPMETRLTNLHTHLEQKYRYIPSINRDRLINHLTNDITELLVYVNPSDDITLTDTYIGFRGENEITNGSEMVNRFLHEYALKP